MSTHIIPQKRPCRSRHLPREYDPYRRLLAAIVLQALFDVIWPKTSLTPSERDSAQTFIRENPDLIIELANTTPERYALVLGG